jgi:hypothetical protein
VAYKKQELVILREHLGSPPVFSGVCVAHLFSFLCCVFSGSVLLIFLVFCVVFLVGSVLLICLAFCVVLFVLLVFVLCLVYPMLPVSLDCPYLIAPSVFSNVCA